MELSEILSIIVGIVASVGGAGAIIWALSSYLGRIWADKYLESIKKENQKEIERLEGDLVKELETHKGIVDVMKETTSRYSGQQFELYDALWIDLCRLKAHADVLWVTANWQNLMAFTRQLGRTKRRVEDSALFIEEEHYVVLKDLLDQFGWYEHGKKKLIELYVDGEQVNHSEIMRWIRQNGERKRSYENIMDRIREALKKQLRAEMLA